jgi:transposase-like protein
MGNKRTGSITALASAARWREAEARAAVMALEESGEPVTRFAARYGIAPHRLYGWRRRLKATAGIGFVEVDREEVAHGRHAELVEIVLTTGDVVRVPSTFAEVALGRVIAALRGGRGC